MLLSLRSNPQTMSPYIQKSDGCKGISLEVYLVTWVGSHLRAVVSPIAFSLSPVFPSVTIRVNPLNIL